jgi:hypothetical protein
MVYKKNSIIIYYQYDSEFNYGVLIIDRRFLDSDFWVKQRVPLIIFLKRFFSTVTFLYLLLKDKSYTNIFMYTIYINYIPIITR